MKKLIKTVSALMAVSVVIGLSSCSKSDNSSKETTDEEEVAVPETLSDIEDLDLDGVEDVTAVDVEEVETVVPDDDDNASSSSSSSSEDIDRLLDKYEKCMNTYVKLMKKIQNGDQSAYAEYMRYMNEVQSLTEEA